MDDEDLDLVDSTAGPAAGGPAFEEAEGVRQHWDEIVADMEATAAEYRERGWDVLELHPGQVRLLADPPRLDALVPDNEYDDLVGFVEDGDVDSYEVFRAEESLVFFLLVLRNETAGRVVCLPGYYTLADGRAAVARVGDVLTVSVRRLRQGEFVTLTLDDPAEFFPESVLPSDE